MEDKLKGVFLKCRHAPRAGLDQDIWSKICLQNKRNLRLKFWVFTILGSGSFIALIPALKALSANLTQSGFYEYLSVALSADGSIFNYWKDFLLLLAESLPVLSITLLLILIFTFFLSIKYATKQIINNQLAV